jgi:hypothetical protein
MAAALPPLPAQTLLRLHNDPAAWQAFRAAHAGVPLTRAWPRHPPAAKLAWTQVFSGLTLSNPILLTDGTVLAHNTCSNLWHRLTPDINGSYANGTWALTAAMPSSYAPRFFASGVLPDGRVIVEGGEYNGSNCDDVETTKGAIYDPQTNTWQSVAPPTGWAQIGDAASIVLPNGNFLLSTCCGTSLATLNPTTLTWTSAAAAGKADSNNEENWTLLPNGNVLTVDAYTIGPTGNPIACGSGSEFYAPATGTWTSAGSTLHKLAGCTGTIQDFEAPTQTLFPNGTLAAFGSTAATTNQPVWTAKYSTANKTWTSKIEMPTVAGEFYTMADAPAAVLPNGNVLIAASPAVWSSNQQLWYPAPTHFFLFNGTGFTQIADVADSPNLSSFEMNFLVLPSGEVLGVETDYDNSEILPAICCANAAWAPTITSVSSDTLTAGASYTLNGTQLNGLTQGATFGDDAQADTNFPLVRITNTATSHVFYARSFGFTRTIARGAASSTSFAVPSKIETGSSSLVVVANGIASKPVAVTVKAAPAPAAP